VGTGLLVNRVAVTTPLTLRSINGPQATVIQGDKAPDLEHDYWAVRCVYLSEGSILSVFTLTNGTTRIGGDYPSAQSGGGLWCGSTNALVSNCVLVGNSAFLEGGGAYGATLDNCALTGNQAGANGGGANSSALSNCTVTGNSAWDGGGVHSGTLNNCTLSGNSAWRGGGVYSGTLNNCIVYYNSDHYGNNWDLSTLDYCCTTPLPAGTGNLTNAPSFVNTNAWSNLRLQSNSPCINAGNNSYLNSTIDLDGNPRIVGGTVDMGAYEYQSPPSDVLRFGGFRLTNGVPDLEIIGMRGSRTLVIEASSDLQTWHEVFRTNALLGGVVQFLDPTALTEAQRFYWAHAIAP
jgi:hypothetical protein